MPCMPFACQGQVTMNRREIHDRFNMAQHRWHSLTNYTAKNNQDETHPA